MEQNTTSPRLHALDGVRGIAILLVILNHLNVSFIAPYVGPFLSQMLFTSGVTGVSLLFILSGFFMAYIYSNPASSFHFLQKRYTRIFPLFLTMVCVRLTFWLEPQLIWYVQLAIILFYALISHFIWVFLVKKYATLSLRKAIFICFLLLQFFVGGFYLFYIMRYPPIFFNQQFPSFFRNTTIGLVNGTLTLPLGDYIPMLDGVYWSLVSEVLFYVLYPIVCVPIVQFLIPQKRWKKLSFLFLLIPFFIGLTLLTSRLFVLSMLQVYICFYFITGIMLGYVYKHKSVFFETLDRFFTPRLYLLSFVLFLFLIFFKTVFLSFFPVIFSPFIHILWAFPLTFVIGLSLHANTSLSKILSSKWLVFFGTISYSIYLTHTSILHLAEAVIQPHNLLTDLVSVLFICFVTIVISSITYYLLERPYFKRDLYTERGKKQAIYKESAFSHVIKRPGFIFITIVILYVLAVFSAYQSNFNFFSTQSSFSHPLFLSQTLYSGQKIISMRGYPVVHLQVTSTQDNFEIFTMHIAHVSVYPRNTVGQNLIFRIKESDTNMWYATNSYALKAISNNLSRLFVFGFPVISNSKNKQYSIELSMSNPRSSEYIILDSVPGDVQGVYRVDKKQFIRHPLQFIFFLENRVITVIENKDAETALFFFFPLMIFWMYLFYDRKRS